MLATSLIYYPLHTAKNMDCNAAAAHLCITNGPVKQRRAKCKKKQLLTYRKKLGLLACIMYSLPNSFLEETPPSRRSFIQFAGIA
jgi:DMSO/TMAO reductase YedYZ heme-binding membrane subunit